MFSFFHILCDAKQVGELISIFPRHHIRPHLIGMNFPLHE